MNSIRTVDKLADFGTSQSEMMMVAVEVDEMSQMSSQLFKGLIQHLMTLQRYTDTILASHYSDIHVSIPPDPADFGTLPKVQ